jgi:hypothetical protein
MFQDPGALEARRHRQPSGFMYAIVRGCDWPGASTTQKTRRQVFDEHMPGSH